MNKILLILFIFSFVAICAAPVDDRLRVDIASFAAEGCDVKVSDRAYSLTVNLAGRKISSGEFTSIVLAGKSGWAGQGKVGSETGYDESRSDMADSLNVPHLVAESVLECRTDPSVESKERSIAAGADKAVKSENGIKSEVSAADVKPDDEKYADTRQPETASDDAYNRQTEDNSIEQKSGLQYRISTKVIEYKSGRQVKLIQSGWGPPERFEAMCDKTAYSILVYAVWYKINIINKPKTVKQVFSDYLLYQAGYTSVLTDFDSVSDYGYSLSCTFATDRFVKDQLGDRFGLRSSLGFGYLRPAKDTVESLWYADLSAGLGYTYNISFFDIIPYLRLGVMASRMSYDDRDEAVPPFQYQSSWYFNPLSAMGFNAIYRSRPVDYVFSTELIFISDGGNPEFFLNFSAGVGHEL
ncbi:MAG: hypothetical protein JXK07_03140 [Spirochaetes bacterium]|nr:hypothetical protein [Spirochaetota bacterium]MBN2771082.1 hypothetical protein [Spirochaetota bacterium]